MELGETNVKYIGNVLSYHFLMSFGVIRIQVSQNWYSGAFLCNCHIYFGVVKHSVKVHGSLVNFTNMNLIYNVHLEYAKPLIVPNLKHITCFLQSGHNADQ